MLIDSAKIKLDNMLSNYQVYNKDWLDVLVRRISNDNIYRELLEKCANPKEHLDYYIADSDIVHLLMLILTSHKYKFQEPILTLDTGFIVDLSISENTVVYPYLVINGDFTINVEDNADLMNYLHLSKNNGNLEFIEDPIKNSDVWKKLVNTSVIDADASSELLHGVNTAHLTDIKHYYDTYINKTHIELHGDIISVFNGVDTYRFSSFELSPMDDTVGEFNLKWFGNDLWFYRDNDFVFALNKLDTLHLFALDSVTLTPYSIIKDKRLLYRVEEAVEGANYTQLNDGFILPRHLYTKNFDQPCCVVTPYQFTKDDKSYVLYYSHNKVIAEVEVKNEYRET